MESALNLNIEKLPEGPYLATSEAIPGLIVQAMSLDEINEIAIDVAEKLREARSL